MWPSNKKVWRPLVYGNDQFANLSVPFQNAMPLDTHESAKSSSFPSSPNPLSNFSQLAFKMLSQFRTPNCPNLRQYSKRQKRCAWLCTDTKLRIVASNFWARKLCRPITLQPSVATATCWKPCVSQIVLLQYKAQPYLGFQNLGCHFDTQKRPKKTVLFVIGVPCWKCMGIFLPFFLNMALAVVCWPRTAPKPNEAFDIHPTPLLFGTSSSCILFRSSKIQGGLWH